MAQQDITSPIIFASGYVKRFSTALGFNSTPSSVDLEIVVPNGNSFASGLLNPGTISGISVGALNFTGIVQSWSKNKSSAGITHTVRLVDPRIMFNDITVLMNGTGPTLPIAPYLTNGSGIYNVINVYNVFGNDYAANYTDNGMSWNNIKYALQHTSGYLNCYDKGFYLEFDSGWDAPDYLRINTQETSLTSLLDTVSRGLGLEYFAYIDPTTFVASTGVISKIIIKSINRSSDAVTAESLDAFLEKQESSGILLNYSRGRELRSGPTDVVVQGSPYSFMYTTSASLPCWGRLGNGALLTNVDNGSTEAYFNAIPGSDELRHIGIVPLDNLQTDDPLELIGLPTILPIGRSRAMSVGSVYPPTVFNIEIGNTIYGYYPTENVMRAALYNRESWETMIYIEQTSIANQFGINGLYIKPTGSIMERVIAGTGVSSDSFRFEAIGSNIISRSDRQEALIQIIYEATKNAADTYYGKQFVVPLPLGQITYGSTTGYGTTINYRNGYHAVDSAWHENADIALKQAGSSRLRSDDGRIRGHIMIKNINIILDPGEVIINPAGNLVYGINKLVYDYSNVSKDSYVITSGGEMLLACSYETDNTNNSRVIARIDTPLILADFEQSNFPTSYTQFWRAVGINEQDILKLCEWSQYFSTFGLAPQRQTSFQYFYVPVENELKRYGPFMASNGKPGGTSYIIDDSLNPWSYAGFTGMNAAGTGIANAALADKYIIDSASFSLAGLPIYNLGDIIGDSSNINQINLNLDSNGLSTNYAAQTFANPFIKYVRQSDAKLYRINYLTNKFEKEKIKFEDYVHEAQKNFKEKDPDYKPTLHNKGPIDQIPVVGGHRLRYIL